MMTIMAMITTWMMMTRMPNMNTTMTRSRRRNASIHALDGLMKIVQWKDLTRKTTTGRENAHQDLPRVDLNTMPLMIVRPNHLAVMRTAMSIVRENILGKGQIVKGTSLNILW